MSHPFALNPVELEHLDLDFEQSLTDEEAEQFGAGLTITTQALGEEGGCQPPPIPAHPPGPIVCVTAPCLPYPWPHPWPPIATTLAIGEEGGDTYV